MGKNVVLSIDLIMWVTLLVALWIGPEIMIKVSITVISLVMIINIIIALTTGVMLMNFKNWDK